MEREANIDDPIMGGLTPPPGPGDVTAPSPAPTANAAPVVPAPAVTINIFGGMDPNTRQFLDSVMPLQQQPSAAGAVRATQPSWETSPLQFPTEQASVGTQTDFNDVPDRACCICKRTADGFLACGHLLCLACKRRVLRCPSPRCGDFIATDGFVKFNSS
ncbi:NEDD4-like E3 ubiquitin-protein ligase WWP2 [Frankliniella fusca]|uniref:NEDD4-like E3 ubiquitin-protein ligase WWP2 n=1 Tax=Frankliniella fusca TaxID=407009 RepID=A0AAE1HG50_9NEOP|nr:NEDD4-like E3 ubiquitin-protein ligase WWP2 [Frankliniella fusca]